MGCCEGELEGVVLVLVGGLLGPGMLVGDSLELVCCIADFHFLSWVSGISFVWLPVCTIILVVKLLSVSEAECSNLLMSLL